jgi:hypothetical protein
MSQRLDGVREANRGMGSLSRHSSFRRAVCVDALVRICAGAIREDRPYRDQNRELQAIDWCALVFSDSICGYQTWQALVGIMG